MKSVKRDNLIPFETENGKWGYMDKNTQEKIIEPTYDLAYPFVTSSAIIGMADIDNKDKIKYGLIDTLGNYLLQPIYDFIKFPNFGYYLIKDKTGTHILNSQLQEVLSSMFDEITILDKEYALLLRQESKGVYNLLKQQEILPAKYDDIAIYSNNYIKVKKDGKYGLFDKNGNPIGSIKYDFIANDVFTDGYTLVSYDGLDGILDTTGTDVVSAIYKNILDIDAHARIFISYEKGKTNVYDMDNQLLFSGIYGGPYGTQGYHEGLMAFANNQGWGFIDNQGKLAIPYMYDFIDSFGFHNGYAVVRKKDKVAVINKQNKIVMPFVSHADYRILEDSSICIINKQNNLSRLINNELEEIIPSKYNEIESLGKGYYKVKMNELYGLVDKYGNEILSAQYMDIKNINSDIIPFININGQYGFYNSITRQLIPSKHTYSQIDDIYLKKGFTTIREDSIIHEGKILLLDRNGQEYVVKRTDFNIF